MVVATRLDRLMQLVQQLPAISGEKVNASDAALLQSFVRINALLKVSACRLTSSLFCASARAAWECNRSS